MNNKKQIECYIKECLQIDIHLTKMPKAQADKLPMVITGAFDLMVGYIYRQQVIFAKDKTAQYTPLQLRKVAGLICDKTGLHCVFVVDQLSSYNQSRLIKQGVNFILPGKLMFMPELLIDIRPIRNRFNQDSKMPITAQVIMLYHLERQPIRQAAIADIAKKSGVSYATCNKALTWLRGHELATETKAGKRKLISIDKDKRAVWEKALPFMYSPVERILYTDAEVSYQSGYNALAAYSHLAHTEEDAGYTAQESSTGKHEHFRFRCPTNTDFPEQIELFSRDIGILTVPNGAHLTPIPLDEDLSSLSAILMNDAYYHYTISHSELVDGIHVARPDSLICLKCRAYTDLAMRRAQGEPIDSRKVNKHKRDVFRLIAMMDSTQYFAVPADLYHDIALFIDMVKGDLPNSDMLKAIGIYGSTSEEVLLRLTTAFTQE